jgi:hypothetical protein
MSAGHAGGWIAIRARGVNTLLADTCSIIVSTFIACRVTIRLRAPLGMATYFCGVGVTTGALFRSYGGKPCGLSSPTLVMGGTAPGVLFLVTRRCSRFVPFRVRLDVGFLDFIIGCASVIRGIVMMGVSSITLCCLSRSTCCCSIITLCSSPSFGRLSILLMLVRSALISSLPCVVLATFAVSSSISLANARRCCIGVKLGFWQCCGYSSVDPDMRYALVSGIK